MEPVFMAVLYRKGANPEDPGAEWRQIVIRSQTWPPSAPYLIEEYSGTKKERKGPDTASLDSEMSLDDAVKECKRMVSKLEGEGFEALFNPFTPPSG